MALSLGADWQNGLWASPYRLRFELCQGDSYINMFTSAYDRSRALARAALPAGEVICVIAAYPNPKRELGAQQLGWTKGTAFEILAAMGVSTEPATATWKGFWWAGDAEDDDTQPWVHRAVRLTWDQVDILIWNQLAHDISVSPQAPVMSKFIDIERSVSVSVYDDRGLDITALNKESISTLYSQFSTWLLDYDRPRMQQKFEN